MASAIRTSRLSTSLREKHIPRGNFRWAVRLLGYRDSGNISVRLYDRSRHPDHAHAGVFLYQNDDVLRDPTEHYIYTLYAGPNFLIWADSDAPAFPNRVPAFSWVWSMMGSWLVGGAS